MHKERITEAERGVEAAAPLLKVDGLVTEFRTRQGVIQANANISFQLNAGETLGVVGESGSGKSVLCRSILRLIPSPPGRIREGQILYRGRDLLQLSEQEMERLRGTEIKMVFQNPMTSLNPVWPIGDQVTEALRVHYGLGRSAARGEGISLLRQVGIPSPEARFDDYPFQWSGGMLQRAVIAMAMAGDASILLADEPTTALDVTIQDQILALLIDLQSRTGMAMIFVSHDIAVVAETCDRVAVMYAGKIMEVANTKEIFRNPRHPYTVGLLSSIPRLDENIDRLVQIPGQPPDLNKLAGGCPFAERCQLASPDCVERPIRLREIEPGHETACQYPERLDSTR